MDYDRLKQVLPKEPSKWTVSDTEIWLNFIGLPLVIPAFKQFSIDGSIIESLSEADLRDEMQIKSNITIKKLMSWIKVGIRQYQSYIAKQLQTSFKGNSTIQIQDKPQKPQKHMSVTYTQYQPKESDKKQTIENKNDKIELIIKQEDMEENIVHYIGVDGAKIGRHNSNHIPIVEESVSRYHSEIVCKDKNFYIRDIGSTSGTFIKLKDKIRLEEGMLLEIGSYLFLIEQIQGNRLRIQVMEGPQSPLTIEVQIQTKISIGRKTTNKISFPGDPHMSNNHACIFIVENNLYLQDLQATNGTWHRLSAEGVTSPYHLLSNGDLFKISTHVTYSCRVVSLDKLQKNQPLKVNCLRCSKNQKNCVLMPCKHNCVCIQCSQNLNQCPSCRTKISERIKIYG